MEKYSKYIILIGLIFSSCGTEEKNKKVDPEFTETGSEDGIKETIKEKNFYLLDANFTCEASIRIVGAGFENKTIKSYRGLITIEDSKITLSRDACSDELYPLSLNEIELSLDGNTLKYNGKDYTYFKEVPESLKQD